MMCVQTFASNRIVYLPCNQEVGRVIKTGAEHNRGVEKSAFGVRKLLANLGSNNKIVASNRVVVN